MLSHNLKLDCNMAKTPNIGETKVLICGLLVFIVLLAFFPVMMLSMVTLQPEMINIPYLYSQVDNHLKQSGIAVEKDGCTVNEHELFNSWHTLAHMEDKLMHQENSTRKQNHAMVHEEEDHTDNHPGLLSVDIVGHAILSTNLKDFQSNFTRDIQTQHKEAGSTRPPSASPGETPSALPIAAASPDEIANQPITGTTSSEVSQLIAAQHIDYLSHPTIHWAPHVKRKSGSFMMKRPDQPYHIVRKNIHGVHWQGKIPKVTCILAVPATTRAHARLKYVVNNFRSQHYEGPKQLIIVYHYQDHKGEERIRKLADGYLVKAIPARTMEVPSSTALRYGAWSADQDTDIVARWDVDGWHHPQRLAWQVRALAFSGRQACLLKQWTVTPGNGSRSVVSGEFGASHSLIGERAWMDKHWQPFLPEGEQALSFLQGQVASLDNMPELLVMSLEHEEQFGHNSTVPDETGSQ